MAEISITELGADTYSVVVDEGASSTEHIVTVTPGDFEGLGDVEAVDVVAASFRFLLDREPKESILPRFELGVISRYFPEYPEKLGDYL